MAAVVLRERSTGFRRVPESALTLRLGGLMRTVLRAAERRSYAELERFVRETVSVRAAQSVTPEELMLAIGEVETGLLDLVVAEDGAGALDGDRWYAIQRALEHALRVVAADVSIYLERYRSIDRRRLQTLLGLLPEAIFVLDEDEAIQCASKGVRALTGLEPVDVIGSEYLELVVARLRDRLAAPKLFAAAMRRGQRERRKPHRDEFRLRSGRILLRASHPIGADGDYRGRVVLLDVRAAGAEPRALDVLEVVARSV